jgi:glyoxylase-like metal-dependent hydrolase (beta-lactamase superfamily II)
MYLTTTTIIAGHDGGCLLIDPALTVSELARLGEWVAARDMRAAAAWSTHAHWDHVLWSAALGADVPRYATARTAGECEHRRAVIIGEVSAEAPGHDLDLVGRVMPLPRAVLPEAAVPEARVPGISVPRAIPWDGPVALVIEHDGHAPGHGAVFLPDLGVLVAGDMLSDVEIPLLDVGAAAGEGADPFADYRGGLGQLAALPEVRHVVPVHGHPGDAAAHRARVAADLRYLDIVQRGEDLADPRLLGPHAAWLRADHARQRGLASALLR